MAQIRTRKTKENGVNLVDIELTKRGKGNRTADNTSLAVLFQDFLTAQEDKGNSEKTIEFYVRGYCKFCEFLNRQYVDRPIAQAYDKQLDEIPPIQATPESFNRYVGAYFPISFLTIDGLERDYRRYLMDRNLNAQTIASYFRAYRAIAYFAMEEEWIPRRKIVVKESRATP